jgi:hypothetical protein
LEETVQTSLRLPRLLVKRLKQACLDRDTNQTAAIIEALEVWLAPAEPAAPGSALAAFRQLIEATPDAADYADFVKHGQPEVVRVVQDLVAAHAKAQQNRRSTRSKVK